MNVYIMCDIEGISGIYTKEQVLPNERRFDEGRKYMTDDINACVKGVKDAGADKVFVCDCHGNGETVIWENITDEADYLISGDTGNERFPGIDPCDCVILLGYHAMAGTAGAVLEHSWSSKHIQNVFYRGDKRGEIGMDSIIVGQLGKKVIMVSGDDKACNEVRNISSEIVTCEVKRGLSTYGAMLMPRGKAHELISQKAFEAVKKADGIKPLLLPKETELTVEVTERSPIPTKLSKPYIDVINGRTYKISAASMEEAVFKLLF